MKNKYLFYIFFMVIFSLSGCSNEPSDSDVAKAVTDAFLENSSFSQSGLAGALINATGIEGVNVDSVEKINCTPNAKNAFDCEVTIDFSIKKTDGSIVDLIGMPNHKRVISKYHLISTSKGWIAKSID
jgi:hypothetical protein